MMPSFQKTLSGPWMLALGCLLSFTTACEEKKEAAPPAPQAERSQSVLAKPGQATEAPAAAHPAAAPAPHVARKGALCPALSGTTELPDKRLTGRGAPGTVFSGGQLKPGRKTWINFWAAWCEPCKKELPLLLEWQKKAQAAGHPFELAFISIDDDQRQLDQFLASFGKLDKTFWLPEGKEREDFLSSMGLSSDPRLPVHVLADASGKLSCRIDGAIEPEDEIEALNLLSKL